MLTHAENLLVRYAGLLPVVSKLFERLMQQQITEYIEKFLSPYLCGYRKGFNTQYALLAMIEKWKKSLEYIQKV